MAPDRRNFLPARQEDGVLIEVVRMCLPTAENAVSDCGRRMQQKREIHR